ncbi:MAG TPA: flagellar basal body P-ring formation chaperone FlgA, partial [Phycisphaeraceae bacterium]
MSIHPVASDRQARTRPRLYLAAAAVVALLTAVAQADSIRLHASAGSHGPQVKLAQVAELEGSAAQALGDLVVASFQEGRDQQTLTLEALRRTLTEAGVNWGLLTLGGYTACQVHRLAETPPPLVEPAAPAAASNPMGTIDLGTPLTLRAQVEALIHQMAQAQQGDLRIRFNEHDQALLAQPTGHHRYELEPGAAQAIGRVPITVRRYDAGRIAQTFTVTADVERRALALVATRSIARGERFTPDSVELREVYLTQDVGVPLADRDQVVGLESAALLRPGVVIYPRHIRSPILVQRGDLVTVRCVVGGLVIRTVGRAMSEGAMDETVIIRNELSRQTYPAVVAGRREVVMQLPPDAADRANP